VTDNLWAVLMWTPILGARGLMVAGGFYVYILRQPSGSGAMLEAIWSARLRQGSLKMIPVIPG
jgi:hypothetical protein